MSDWRLMTDAAVLVSSPKDGIGADEGRKPGKLRMSTRRWIAWRSVFEGMVAVWVHAPPTARFSTTHTCLPSLAHFMAAPSPPGPVPITTTSNERMFMLLPPPNTRAIVHEH